MAAGRSWRTMHGMSTPLVIEARIQLEPVIADPFIADLDTADDRRTALLERLVAAPRRRIYD